VPGLLQPLPGLGRLVGQRGQARVEVIVALRDGAARDDAASAPELLHDRLAIDGEREGLLHERVVERRPLAVHRQHVEAGVEGPATRVEGLAATRSSWSGGSWVITSTSPLSSAAMRGAVSGIGRMIQRSMSILPPQ